MNKLLLTLKSYFPTQLPAGLTAFNTWSDDIISLAGQFADKDSMRFAIASILIHADSKYGSLPMQYFVKRLRKSAANQVASQVFQDVKEAQRKAQEDKSQSPEVTVEAETVTDVKEVL